jgi:hypothetical protein
MKSMESSMTLVKNWFADHFGALQPELQRLHIAGGVLTGDITVRTGTGFAGFLGRRLAQKLGIPVNAPSASISVDIRSTDTVLVWSRAFNNGHTFVSKFEPHGQWPDGYWLERSGKVQIALRVDVRDQAWHWHPIKAWLFGIRIPLRLFPRTTAYKRFEGGLYQFHVSFALPLLGVLLAYQGNLKMNDAS